MALEKPIRDRRWERHQATRGEILDAAWALARSQGLAAISLRELATAVGMRSPSLYSYFESKSAIYDAMFRQGYEELDSREALFTTTSGARAMKTRVRGFLEFCTENPARYQLMFQRQLPDFTPSADSYAVAVRSLERLHASLAVEGATSAADRDLFTALLSGLADQQIANDAGGDRWLRLADAAVDMYLAHVHRHAKSRTALPTDRRTP
jgi:AcrR family transcriptional regulator